MAKANFIVELWTVCPQCNYDFDALGDVIQDSATLPDKPKAATGLQIVVECPLCDKEFIIDETTY